MTTTLNTEPFTTALLALLRTNSIGVDVGDSDAPASPSPSYPYAVLYGNPSTEFSEEFGTLSDPDAHRWLSWQLTSVGRSRQQAQGCADHLRATVQASSLVVAGRNVWRLTFTTLGEVERDDDVDLGGQRGSLFYVNEEIGVLSSPG